MAVDGALSQKASRFSKLPSIVYFLVALPPSYRLMITLLNPFSCFSGKWVDCRGKAGAFFYHAPERIKHEQALRPHHHGIEVPGTLGSKFCTKPSIRWPPCSPLVAHDVGEM